MAVTKITVSTAMRARDVSRPSAEHLAEAAGPEEAEEMLESLSGRTHEVVSGLALITPMWEEVRHETTSVTFRGLTPRDIAWYVASSEWEGRAGGYAIQGQGAALVERIEGDFFNVVGLPVARVYRMLKAFSSAS